MFLCATFDNAKCCSRSRYVSIEQGAYLCAEAFNPLEWTKGEVERRRRERGGEREEGVGSIVSAGSEWEATPISPHLASQMDQVREAVYTSDILLRNPSTALTVISLSSKRQGRTNNHELQRGRCNCVHGRRCRVWSDGRHISRPTVRHCAGSQSCHEKRKEVCRGGRSWATY